MSYSAAVDHLYARGLELAPDPSAPAGTRRKFDLAHMRTLAHALGDPQQSFPSVLIAGTNGKGSTAATLASILTAAGYRTALYTSPHLSRVNERIRIDGQPISDDDFARLYFQVDSAAERLVAAGKLPHHPSFFETLTAVAFLHFAGHPEASQNRAPHLSESSQNRVPHLRGEAAKVGLQDASQIPVQEGVTPQASATPHRDPREVSFRTETGKAEEVSFRAKANKANEVSFRAEPRSGVVEEPPHSAMPGIAITSESSNPTPAPHAPSVVRTAPVHVAPVDIAILEVGLGGRLDATNIVDPLLSILTDISLDHQDYLGDTITEITREKAGILRPHGTLITLPQHPEANQAIGEAAAALELHAISAANYIPTTDKLLSKANEVSFRAGTSKANEVLKANEVSFQAKTSKANEVSKAGRTNEVSFRAERSGAEEPPHFAMPGTATPLESSPNPGLSTEAAEPRSGEPRFSATNLPRNRYTITLAGQPLLVDSPLYGQHQQRNLALALAAAEELRNPSGYNLSESNINSYKISRSQIEAGIRKTLWPGRLELIPLRGSAPLLLDVAHNPAGAWTVRAMLARLPDETPRTLLFSCLRDKDLREMSQILLPLFDASSPDRPHDHILFAPINSPRAASLEELAEAARALDIPAESCPSLEAALTHAQAITPPNGIIIATGSVYLIGELRALVLGSP